MPSSDDALALPFRSSSVIPSHTIRPSAMTTDLGAIRAASSMLCETISIVSCWRWQTSCTSASICWRRAGSSAENGSSSSSIGCSGKRHALTLAAGKLAGQPVEKFRDPHLGGNDL